MGPQPLVNGGVGLGIAACPPVDSEASKSALAADSSPEAWLLDSRGISLSPSLATLARLKPNLSSGLARVGIQVDSFPTSQPIRQGSSQLRPARLTASLDGPLKGSQTALVRAATAATGSATTASRQLPSDRAGNNDTMDVLGEPGDPPQLAEWRRLWQLAGAAYLNRQHRVLWWRTLHGCVMCRAFSAYNGRATPQQACCPVFFFLVCL